MDKYCIDEMMYGMCCYDTEECEVNTLETGQRSSLLARRNVAQCERTFIQILNSVKPILTYGERGARQFFFFLFFFFRNNQQ